MGSILCCVDDKRNYEGYNKHEDYRLATDSSDANNNVGSFLKKPVDHKEEDVISLIYNQIDFSKSL